MAAPVYASDLSDIYVTQSSLINWSALGGGQAGLNLETDYYIVDSECISKNAFADSLKGMIYDNGSGIVLASDGAFFIWGTHQTANSLDTKANGGLRALVGSSNTAYRHYYVEGGDTIVYGKRWVCFVVDPSVATANQTTGSPTSTYRTFGILANMVGGPTKGAPLAVGGIRYGRWFTYTNGDLANGYATFTGAASFNDQGARKYGQIQKVNNTFQVQGGHRFGTDTTAVDFRDSDKNIEILDTEFTSTNFNLFEVNNSTSRLEWTNIQITALGTNSRGNFVANANADIVLNTCVFTNLGTFSFGGIKSIITSVTYRRTDQVTGNGASFVSNTFEQLIGSISLSIADLISVSKCVFIKRSTGTNHAVELTSIGSGAMNWDSTATNYATGLPGSPAVTTSTGNETIYVNVASGTLNINVASGATIPSIRTAGVTVNVLAAQVTLTFNVLPAITGYEWRLYTVTASGSLAGASEQAGEETATLSSQSYTYVFSAGTIVAIQIIASGYVEEVRYLTLANSDQTIDINLEIETN